MRPVKLTALLCGAALLAGAAFAAPAALASRSETVFFEAPRDLVGVSPGTQAKTIAKLETLGVHAIRVVLYWGEVAPSPNHKTRPKFSQSNPAAYNWGAYDQLINAVTALHWTVLLTVSGGFGTVPRWATPHGEDRYSYPSASDYGQFLEAVGKHYGKKVKLFSIWNEPNQPQYLQPQYVKGKLVSAEIYRSLFLAGYAGLKASGNFSGMRVLMGETSPVGVQSAGIPAPLAFLRGVLCLNSNYQPVGHCAKLPAYGYAQHPYAEGPGPFWIPPLDPHHDDVTIGTLGRLVTALNRAAAVGAIRADMPIYITEFGIQSVPYPAGGVSLARQAELDAISEKIAFSNPRVVSFDQYLLRSDVPGGGAAAFQTGLETNAGVAKPSLDGFRLPLVVTRTHTGVSFWGIVRPAGDSVAAPATGASGPTGATGSTGSTGSSGSTSGPTTVVLQYSSDGGRVWRTLRKVRTNSTGAWSASGNFASRRLWRTKWVSRSGVTYLGAPTRAYTTSGKIDY
jgi:hypothetical protein